MSKPGLLQASSSTSSLQLPRTLSTPMIASPMKRTSPPLSGTSLKRSGGNGIPPRIGSSSSLHKGKSNSAFGRSFSSDSHLTRSYEKRSLPGCTSHNSSNHSRGRRRLAAPASRGISGSSPHHPRSYSEHAFRSDSRLLCPHGLRYKSLCVFCHHHEEKSKGGGKRDSHRRWSPSSTSSLGSDKKNNSTLTSSSSANKKLWNALGGGGEATGAFIGGGGTRGTTASVLRPGGGGGIGRDGDRPMSQYHQRSRRNSFGSVSRLSCGTEATTVSNASSHHSKVSSLSIIFSPVVL